MKGFSNILTLIIVALGLAASIYLVKHPTLFKPKAANDGTRIEFVGNPTNSNVTLKLTYVQPSPTPAPINLGINIDIRDQNKIPTKAQADSIKPSWVRFVFPCNDSAGKGCPDDYHKTNLIDSIPSGIKKLAVINGESTWDAQNGSTDQAFWKTYIDSLYVPTVQKIIKDYGSKIDGVELWNEQDLPASSMPASSYGYLVQTATAAIKATNPNIKVITGGLASGNPSYLAEAKSANPKAFEAVDGIGIHPYHLPGEIKNVTTDLSNLKNLLSQTGINKPIWVTEFGLQEFTQSTSPKNQAELLTNVVNQFLVFQPKPELALWYSFTDLMGGDSGSNWGLFDGGGNIKASGNAFKGFTFPSPAPFPDVYRLANAEADLPKAKEVAFTQNPTTTAWTLTPGNGIKVVFGQFKVSGTWGPIVSSPVVSINIPSATPTPSPTKTPTPKPTPSPTPSCSDDQKYCDGLKKTIIWKHAGYWNGKSCTYAFTDTKVKCDPRCPDDFQYCDATTKTYIHKTGGYYNTKTKACVYAFVNTKVTCNP